MRQITVRKIWVLAFLMAGFAAGCGTAAVAPAVTGTAPLNHATSVPVAAVITATFNTAMKATTISTSTFTVSGPGATAVAGAVTYSGTTATFTPTSALAASTLYTATITTV